MLALYRHSLAYWSIALALPAISHTSVNFQLLLFISAARTEHVIQILTYQSSTPLLQIPDMPLWVQLLCVALNLDHRALFPVACWNAQFLRLDFTEWQQ